jgi:hypothetical protein
MSEQWISQCDPRIGPMQAEIERLRQELEGAKVVLVECANIIRPKLPSLADNVIGAHIRRIDAALSNEQGVSRDDR